MKKPKVKEQYLHGEVLLKVGFCVPVFHAENIDETMKLVAFELAEKTLDKKKVFLVEYEIKDHAVFPYPAGDLKILGRISDTKVIKDDGE